MKTALSRPLIIGATGGSGTRVVARIVRDGGFFLGTHLNESEDAIGFGAFSDRWVTKYVRALKEQNEEALEGAMRKDLEGLLQSHCAALSLDAHPLFWGWKEPRSIYLLPFWQRVFPAFKFLHLVRDGRDMALSGNQNQLAKHGPALLSWQERWLSRPARSMLLWSRINTMAADYGARQMTGRYLLVRFEDLCAEPWREVRRIFRFCELGEEAVEMAVREIARPPTLGRWRREPLKRVFMLERLGDESLRRFGYLDQQGEDAM
jgi:hypothetical protein